MGEVQGIAYFLIGLAASGLLLEVARIALICGVVAVVFRRPIKAFVAFCEANTDRFA
jgi:hypothetical protein